MQSKQEIRKQALAKRDLLSSNEINKFSSVICSSVCEFMAKMNKTFHRVALYDPINSEVDLNELADTLGESSVKFLKPIMSQNDYIMEFTDWNNNYKPLQKFDLQSSQSPFDIVKPEDIDAIICPVVAFDKKGHRLGYGGGYYDRYLPRLKPSTPKIGVAFSCQQVEQIPTDAFDVPLDIVITENSILTPPHKSPLQCR